MSRSHRQSKDQTSSFQQSFVKENAFKRNKRYINFQQINKNQHDHETSRRRPFSSSEKSVDDKISNSFMNTTAAFSDKVEQEIGKFKLRIGSVSGHDDGMLNDFSRSQRSFSSRGSRNIQESRSARSFDESSKKKIRGMALDKYCSRQQYYQSKNKPIIDQRLFNNYSEMQTDQKHIRDFGKSTQRDLDFSHKHLHQLQYNTQKLYEDYYYKKTSMQCNFKYKKGNKNQRGFFVLKRKEDQPATDMNPQKVKNSYDKCSLTGPKNTQCFYSNSGRELPSQLDMRLNNNLTNEWVDNRGKILRKTKEYSLRKMKNDLVDKKIDQIKAKKKPTFDREQLCDSMYFRVHPIG